MRAEEVRALLEEMRAGRTSLEQALERLVTLPFADLGFARVDHHRSLRQGVPEVILAEYKTAEQVSAIALEIKAKGQNVLVTRLDAEKGRLVCDAVAGARYNAAARTASLLVHPVRIDPRGKVAIVTAGTSDLPVAAEALETLALVGLEAELIQDVGVAGLHRLLATLPELRKAQALIVVAGMEGALASVIGGLIAAPIVAVPTSVGYGAAFGGMAALLGMLTSCAAGVTVVNIDNGFGAAMAVARMLGPYPR